MAATPNPAMQSWPISKSHYGEAVRLEHVLLTHSDADHASGLRAVLKEIPVTNLWLHVPWLLAREAISLFADKRWTPDGLEKYVKKEYDIISEIFDLATAAGCKMFYPFRGDGVIGRPSLWIAEDFGCCASG